MLTLNDGRSELWQWDTGRTLAVDADCSQVHFSNKVFGRSIDVDVTDGVAIIPDILLQTDKDLNVWAFVGTAENGYTKISKTFKVNRRNKPADYVFTPQEQILLKDAIAIVETAKSAANDAIESANKAQASADMADQIADEMKRLADHVEQNTETAIKAKADALIAKANAEAALASAETAREAAEDAANSAGTNASVASAAATRAENAATNAMNALAGIQSLYQTMQEYVSQSVQDIQTEGNTQVQRVADEGAAKTAAAKEQADRAQSEADRAEAARAKAEEVVESCIPDDTAVDGKPWTSKKIVDSLCMPIEESGNPVQCYPVENYPLGVRVSWEPVQEGSGDPSPDNIRPITGRDAVSVTRCGRNLLKPPGINKNQNGIVFTANDDGTVTINGTSTSTAYYNYFDGNKPLQLAEGDYVLIPGSNLTRITVQNASTYTIYASEAGKNRIVHIPSGKYIIFFAIDSGNTADNVIARPQIVLGTTATPYEPYTGDAYGIALPETVYGGTLDLETGVVTVNMALITLDRSKLVSITNSVTGKSFYQMTNTNLYYPEPADNQAYINANTSCNVARIVEPYAGGEENEYLIYVLYDNRIRTSVALYDSDADIKICYPIKAPKTIQLTEHQIAALSGVNTIYTDADGVVVTGAEDPKHTITELKNAIISLGGNI